MTEQDGRELILIKEVNHWACPSEDANYFEVFCNIFSPYVMMVDWIWVSLLPTGPT